MKVVIPLTVALFPLLLLPPAAAFGTGPPLDACATMFPVGHGFDAQLVPPPYELSVSTTQVTLGSTVTVTLKVKDGFGQEYFEGIFVQARLASCESVTPVGTFSIPQHEFLKLLSCGGVSSSAVAHGQSSRQTSQTFTWTAPTAGPLPRIYFQATVVKEKNIFWTNVFSPYIGDPSLGEYGGISRCKVVTKRERAATVMGSASSSSATSSLIFVAVVTANGLARFF